MDGLWIAIAAVGGTLVGWLLGRRSSGEAGLRGQIASLERLIADREAIGDTRISLETEFGNLKQTVAELRQLSETGANERAGAEGSIKQLLTQVSETTAKIGDATTKLATSLGRSTDRGQWGQASFQSLLEGSGLQLGFHFETQHAVHDADGNRLIPDFVLRLPGNDFLLVDAKFPMAAYLRAEDTDDQQLRAQFLADHAKEVLKHAKDLADKHYTASVNGPQFVAMYLPLEALWSEALHADPTLLRKCLDHHVIPITPTTAFALLSVTQTLWRESQLTDNARAIAAAATTFVERLAKMAKVLGRASTQLNTAAGSYNEFVSYFNNSFVRDASRLHAQGVRVTKELGTVSETGAVFGEPRQFEDIIDVEPIDELPSPNNPASDD